MSEPQKLTRYYENISRSEWLTLPAYDDIPDGVVKKWRYGDESDPHIIRALGEDEIEVTSVRLID